MARSRVIPLKLSALIPNRLLETRVRATALYLGLGTKLLFIVIAVSLVGVLTSSLLLLNWQRGELIESAEIGLDRLAVPITASLQHAMLSHDQTMINAIVQAVGQEPGVQLIRILDVDGRVRSSSFSGEIGQPIDRATAECRHCHMSGNSAGAISKTSALVETAQTHFLVSVSPIPNSRQCSECHDPSVKNLGLVMIEAPIKDLNTQILESAWHIGLAALFTFALLVGLMVPILRKYITNPVAELSRGVAEISLENLDYQVQVSSQDEIGHLAEGLEAMRKQLKASRAEMEHRNRELAVLYQIGLITGQLLDVDKILAQVLDTIIEKLSLATGLIYLWDKGQDRFERRVSRGHSEARLHEIESKRRLPGGDLTRAVAESGEAFFVPDKSVSLYFQKFWGKPTASSYINIPLKSQGKVIGTMELTSQIGQTLTERQAETLSVVGHQIGIAIDNNSLLDETRRNAHEATTLHELGTRISSSLELEQVLDAVAAGACQALETDIGLVGLVDEDQPDVCIRATAGTYSADWIGMRLPLEENHETFRFELGRVMNFEGSPRDLPPVIANLIEVEQTTSFLTVPLWRGNQLHGIIAVLARHRRSFAKEDVHLLTRLGQQVLIAIENARLYRQVRYLAVLEERDRLAREMHDNLAQELGYLDLKTTIIQDLLARGELAQAEASLLELKQITREAYTDTREAIFSLRTMMAFGAELAPSLREYLAEYRAHYGLDTRVIMEDESLTQFQPEAGVQVQRIIQEALTNVRKHAQSTRAWLRFERERDTIRITIEDDGRGFDPRQFERDERQRFGMQIMRERAESIGGTIEIVSQVNHGTQVVLRVPATALGEL